MICDCDSSSGVTYNSGKHEAALVKIESGSSEYQVCRFCLGNLNNAILRHIQGKVKEDLYCNLIPCLKFYEKKVTNIKPCEHKESSSEPSRPGVWTKLSNMFSSPTKSSGSEENCGSRTDIVSHNAKGKNVTQKEDKPSIPQGSSETTYPRR